jgi:mRNA interferase YafQ
MRRWVLSGWTIPLKGGWVDHRECHIGGDFLLIYQLDGNTLIFVRAGTHSDLFEE